MPKKTITKLNPKGIPISRVVVVKGRDPQVGVDFEQPKDGVDGRDGVDGYTPIKGVDYFDGYTPVKGVDYFDGYTPIKGIDYFDGERGERGPPGRDGVDGKSLTYDDLTNTQRLQLRGERGMMGVPGIGLVDGGTTGQVLAKRSDASYDTEWVDQTGGGGTPGGSDTQVQFNDGGVFAGDNGFTWDKTTNTLTLGHGTTSGQIVLPYGGYIYDENGEASVTFDGGSILLDTQGSQTGIRDLVAGYIGYLNVSSLTGDRTFTFPDATGTFNVGASGSFSQVGAATTAFTVTIGSTQADTTYKINITPTAALSAALFYISAKTTTTFTVTYLSGLTGTVTFDWLLTV